MLGGRINVRNSSIIAWLGLQTLTLLDSRPCTGLEVRYSCRRILQTCSQVKSTLAVLARPGIAPFLSMLWQTCTLSSSIKCSWKTEYYLWKGCETPCSIESLKSALEIKRREEAEGASMQGLQAYKGLLRQALSYMTEGHQAPPPPPPLHSRSPIVSAIWRLLRLIGKKHPSLFISPGTWK